MRGPTIGGCFPCVLVIVAACAEANGGQDAADAASAPTRAEQVEAFVDGLVAPRVGADDPGVAIAVVEGAAPVFERAYGKSNLERSANVDLHTPFSLASITKTVTALALLIAYEDGAVGLHDSIAEHFPEAPRSWSDVTPHLLMSHQSGLAGVSVINQTNESVLADVVSRPLEFTPSEQYGYTNTEFVVLALLIERAVQQSFEDFVRKRIFEPLGMTDSVMGEGMVRSKLPRAAVTYGAGSEPAEIPELTQANGAVGMYASVEDLKKLAAELRNPTLVSVESVELMFESRADVPVEDEGCACSTAYGLFACECDDQPRYVHHLGGEVGSPIWAERNAFVLQLPDEVTVIELSSGSYDWIQDLAYAPELLNP